MQKYTSANTSINCKKLPKVYSKVRFTGKVLDYGCGKYTVHIRKHLESEDATLLPYDPFNQAAKVNAQTIRTIRESIKRKEPLSVVCSNVLNVIDDEDTVRTICRRIEYIAERTGGHGYCTVYEGDKSGVGRKTGADQYQRNQPIAEYKKYFRRVRISGGILIIGA